MNYLNNQEPMQKEAMRSLEYLLPTLEARSVAANQSGQLQKPSSPPGDTVSSRILLAVQQASELRDRIYSLTGNIIGTEPEPAAITGPTNPSCLLDVLDTLSRQLQASLNQIERLQSRL